jgi:hypothetical protein
VHGHGQCPGNLGRSLPAAVCGPGAARPVAGPFIWDRSVAVVPGLVGNAVYDLDAPGRVVDLNRAVLIEAASPQDLYAYLDERVLRRLWALLWLPAQLRRAWEQRFPVLAKISRITATA